MSSEASDEPGGGAAQAPSGREIVRQIKWMGAGEAVGQAAWYGMAIVLAALLTPRAFGTVAAGMAIVRIANVLTQSGSGGAIIATPVLTPGMVRASVVRTFAAALAFTIAIVIAGKALSHVFARGADPDVIRVLAFSIALASLEVVPGALLKKNLDFKRVSAINGGAAITASTAAIVATLLGLGVWALVMRQLLFEAIVGVLLWAAVRSRHPEPLRWGRGRSADSPRFQPPPGRLAFLMVAGAGIAAMSMDNMIVGATLDATQLGYYALAFSFAFAPLTQISWRIGGVLFPAIAATRDLDLVGRRTVDALRVTALLFLPLVPVAAILAPAVVPATLGEKWAPMVGPFQILLCVGMLHALLNIIGESLSGTGNIGIRAWGETGWAILTLGAVAVLASTSGIEGAAAAHLIGFAPLCALYVVRGSRLIGTSAGEVWRELRWIFAAVAAQAAVTVGVSAALGGPHQWGAAIAGAVAGLAALLGVLRLAPSQPLGELRRLSRLVRPAARAAA